MSQPLSSLEEQFARACNTGASSDVFEFLSNHPTASLEEQLAVLLVDQAACWRSGRGRKVEQYLARLPNLMTRPDLVAQLAAEEFGYREELRHRPKPSDYFRRFPACREFLQTLLDVAPSSEELLDTPPLAGNSVCITSHSEHATEPYVPTPAAAAASTAAIQRIGDYEILGEIARGGMGVVYKARHLRLGNLVAVKLIRSGELAGEHEIRRFDTEAQWAAQLSHPGIVSVHQVGEHAGQRYLAMAYVDGQSLWQQVKESPLEPRTAARLMQQVSEAIQYAHEKGIVHRDLKPQNILVTKEGLPKITDFGLAKNQAGDSSLTATGEVLGTPSYMPPEQADGKVKEVGKLADVYALGATLYCLLTGRPPFQAASLMETLRQVKESYPVAPRQLNPAIARDLEKICMKCLEKEPALRYKSAGELAADLERFLHGKPIRARKIGLIGRGWRWCKRKPVVAALGATAILAVCAVATTMFYARHAREATQIAQVSRQFEAGLDDSELSATYLDEMEQLAEQMISLNAPDAKQARRRLFDRFAATIRNDIAAARLDAQTADRIRRDIDLLRLRDPDLRWKLQQELEQRLGRWEMLAQLEPPFQNVNQVFPDDQVAIENEKLLRTPGKIDGAANAVTSRIVCSGDVRSEVQFDSGWRNASELGIEFRTGPKRGYAFLLSAADPREEDQTAKNDAPKQKEIRFDQRAIVYLSILRNGAPLRVQELSLAVLGSGSLRILAQREGELLTIQVNDLPALSFADGFPLSSAGEALAVNFPAGIGLENVSVHHKLRPVLPSPLEQGDELYAQAQFNQALSFYERQLNEAMETALKQEARYKIGMCQVQLKRETEATAQFRTLAAEIEGERWPILAALQLWTAQIRRNRISEADATMHSLSVRFHPEQIARYTPAEISYQMLAAYEQLSLGGYFKVRPDPDFIFKRERLVMMQELLNAPRYQLIYSKLFLLEACLADSLYFGRAQEIIDELLAERLNNSQLSWLYFLYTELLIRKGAAGDLAAIVNRRLYEADGSLRQDALSLLVYRAKAHGAMGDWLAAEKDLDQFLSLIDMDQYGRTEIETYELAVLIKGFCAAQQRSEMEALEIWKAGYEMSRRYDALGDLYSSILGSLANAITPEDAEQIARRVASRAAGASIVMSYVGQRAISPAKVAAVLRNMWQTPHGRDSARKLMFGGLYGKENTIQVMLTGAELMRHCAQGTDDLQPELAPEIDDLIWKLCEDLFADYQAEVLNEAQVLQIYLTYAGNNNVLGWQAVGPTLDPKRRGPLCYLYGRHYRHLKREKEAVAFFRSALEDAPAGSSLRTLVESELGEAK